MKKLVLVLFVVAGSVAVHANACTNNSNTNMFAASTVKPKTTTMVSSQINSSVKQKSIGSSQAQ